MTAPTETVLVLRTCKANLTSYNGFQWPESGLVACRDWEPCAKCGNGLHGLLWGEGNGDLLSWEDDAKWLVVEVAKADIVDIGGKVKFPKGNVLYVGDRQGATSYIAARAPRKVKSIVGLSAVGKVVSVGYKGQASTGNYGQASAGDHGQASAGYRGQASAGNYGQASAGSYGQASAGYDGQASASYRGQASTGNYGQASAGDDGQASAGDDGQASAGYRGQASAGENGAIVLRYHDAKADRFRLKVGYVGEDGVEAGKKYKLDDAHNFVEVKS